MRERAGARDLDDDILALREREQGWQVGEGFRRCGRVEGLLQAQMVDDQPCVRMRLRERQRLVDQTPAEQVDRQTAVGRSAEDARDPGMVRVGRDPVGQHDAHRDRALHLRPVRDRLRNAEVGGIDRLDEAEAARMRGIGLERIARVVTIHGVGRDEHRPVHAHRVHGGDHIAARDLRRPRKRPDPGAIRMVAFISVDLRVDDRHGMRLLLLRSPGCVRLPVRGFP